MGADQSTSAGSATAAPAAAGGSTAAQSPDQHIDLKSLPSYTRAEVAAHRESHDCWLIIHGLVYDVTALLDTHPGGDQMLLDVAGLDASAEYDEAFHPEHVLRVDALQYLVGRVKKSRRAPPPDSAAASPDPASAPTAT